MWPQAPAGFKVALYYTGLDQPRLIRTAPNGDLFVAISYMNKVMVFRGVGADGKAKQVETFADGLSQPFGIQFYPAGRIRSGCTSGTRIRWCAFRITWGT